VPPPTPAPTDLSGLDQRPSNTTCLAPALNAGTVTIGRERVFPNLTFNAPVFMLQAPGDSSRWFVVEQQGVVRVFDNSPATTVSSVFVDIRNLVVAGGERGLLGMAFHPDWPNTPKAYLSYTASSPLVSRISEFTSPDGGLTLTPSARIILQQRQPEDNHNGGGIAFGPDGFLYIGLGDGGGANDQHGSIGNGQLLTTMLGKMLRIDVNGTTRGFNYRIPPGNPFAGNELCSSNDNPAAPCPEIYAIGFRNPWRWSFDRQMGTLWVGDVGQNTLEEVNRVSLNGNYGWRCREGTRNTGMACGTATSFIPPVAEYGRSEGFSVTGGYVYRGTAIPGLVGRYVFGDFGGTIWNIASDTQPTLPVTAGFDSGLSISSFAEDNDGELYIVHLGGTLHRLTGSGGGSGSVATQLSATGCVSSADAKLPASGLIPYAPHAEFWSDNATKQRWIGLPNGQNITVDADGDWDFPAGTVLVKNFSLGTRLVETRLFMRHPDGNWAGYSYEWNDAQTDATLVVGGKQATVAGQTWIFPSAAQCLQCHTSAAGRSLGLETRQLAFRIPYPQTGRTAHQLLTLNTISTLSPPVAAPTTVVPYPDPRDATASLAGRARSYLHTNCAQCHRAGGPAPTNMDLRFDVPLNQANACDAVPQNGDLGLVDARISAPGAADRSVLLSRMSVRDANAMPPVGSAHVDTAGTMLIRDWIDSLTSCN
jgi:uncharacterized repeat protein (TIGR03806 family)